MEIQRIGNFVAKNADHLSTTIGPHTDSANIADDNAMHDLADETIHAPQR